MKLGLSFGAIAVIVSTTLADAQYIMNNGYFSPTLAIFMPPFFRNIMAQQTYAEYNTRLQRINPDTSYINDRWNRVYTPYNPYAYNPAPLRNSNRQSAKEPKIQNRFSDIDTENDDVVVTDTRNVQVPQNLDRPDDIIVVTPLRPVQSLNDVPVKPPSKQNIDLETSTIRPSNVGADYGSITFVDRLSDRQNVANNNKNVPTTRSSSVALTSFGLQMIKLLNSEDIKNPTISPYSVAEILALLQQGAAGDSESEITKALIMSPTMSKMAFKSLYDSIKKRNTRNVLKVATNIFVNNVFDLNRSFKNTAVQNFDSDITPMDFNLASVSARQINRWVSDKTQNHIPELISADMLSPNTQMVLANAVFFKGLWQNRFDPKNTSFGDFFLSDGSVKRVQYMKSRLGLAVGFDADNSVKYAVIPFEGEQYKIMFVIPEEEDLKTAIPKLTSERLLHYLGETKKDVIAVIPKFTVESSMDLIGILNRMGIQEIFGAQSNLHNVGTYRTFSPQISSALHKAVLSIDEQGGFAAAATLFPAVALSFEDLTITFKLDKPFLAILWDAENAVPLFVSRIDNPSV